MLSYRSFRVSRAADFSFTPGKAAVYVHVDGGDRTASTSTTAPVQKHFDATGMWVDGNTGSDIYLGNLQPDAMTSLSVPNTSKGAGSIPLAATAFTWVTVVAK
jgi:hypothetical protein